MFKQSASQSLDEFLGTVWLVVGGDSSNAVLLDSEVILVHLHVEESVVSPVGTPGVTANPVFGSIFADTVADDRDSVVDQADGLLGVDATVVVVLEVVSGVDTA